MKKYKLLQDVWSTNVESKLNELADDGWVVKSFTTVCEGEDNDNIQYHILMEYDDVDTNTAILDAIEDLTGKIDEMAEGFTGLRDRLVGFSHKLDQISYNTEKD